MWSFPGMALQAMWRRFVSPPKDPYAIQRVYWHQRLSFMYLGSTLALFTMAMYLFLNDEDAEQNRQSQGRSRFTFYPGEIMSKDEVEGKKIIHIKASGFTVQSIEDVTEDTMKEIEERDKKKKEQRNK